MPTKKRDPMVEVKDIADQLGIHYLTAVRLVADGKFPNAINIGGDGTSRRYRIPQSDVDVYRDSLRVVA